MSSNLVQNPSFEQYDTCPTGGGNLYQCEFWWGFSCEYFNGCVPVTLFSPSVPSNGFGFQYAHSGVAYAGLSIYTNSSIPTDYRESIKTKLSDTLITNKRYCTNFYISLTEYSYRYAPNNYIFLDSVGMLFTINMVQDSVIPIFSNGIKVQNDILNLDTINWIKNSNSFIANGGEQYLTIGNFDNFINWPSGKIGNIYVYVDDVSVCECSFKFNLGNDTTLCNGQSLTLNPNMPNATYTWQDGSTDSIYKVTQAGTYWVKAYFADYNITTYDTINIMYSSPLIVNLGNDITLCNGQTLILNATNPHSNYQWQDSTTNNTDTVNQQGIYWVKVTDSNNCTTSDTIKINYQDCVIPNIYIPNSFTPNGDGLNDVFNIKTTFIFSQFKLTIFNRWGEQLFESEDINKGWDGTYKGQPVPVDVYVFQLTATIKENNMNIKKTGKVTVVR